MEEAKSFLNRLINSINEVKITLKEAKEYSINYNSIQNKFNNLDYNGLKEDVEILSSIVKHLSGPDQYNNFFTSPVITALAEFFEVTKNSPQIYIETNRKAQNFFEMIQESLKNIKFSPKFLELYKTIGSIIETKNYIENAQKFKDSFDKVDKLRQEITNKSSDLVYQGIEQNEIKCHFENNDKIGINNSEYIAKNLDPKIEQVTFSEVSISSDFAYHYIHYTEQCRLKSVDKELKNIYYNSYIDNNKILIKDCIAADLKAVNDAENKKNENSIVAYNDNSISSNKCTELESQNKIYSNNLGIIFYYKTNDDSAIANSIRGIDAVYTIDGNGDMLHDGRKVISLEHENILTQTSSFDKMQERLEESSRGNQLLIGEYNSSTNE